MHGTLIKEYDNPSRQKMYQLDFKVYKDIWGREIKDITKTMQLRKEYELDGEQDYVDKVVISDAHTHYERLVFPVFNIINVNTKEKSSVFYSCQIAGNWTYMMYGGNPSSMLEPEEYFEQLYEVNKGFN